jgi:hypothetical protein
MTRAATIGLVAALALLCAPAAAPASTPGNVATAHGSLAAAKQRTKRACKRTKRARTSLAARPHPPHAARAKPRRAVKRRKAKRRCTRPRRHAAKPRAPGAAAPGAPAAPAPAAPAAPAQPAPPEPDGPALPGDPAANPRALQVVAGEFFLSLSKPEVLAGNVRVEFNNAYAEDPHDLKLMRGEEVHGFDELAAGEVEAETFDLKAGTWTLFCALDGHAEKGMSASLRVRAE